MRIYKITYLFESKQQTILIEASDEADAGRKFSNMLPDVNIDNVFSVVDIKKKGFAKVTNIILLLIGTTIIGYLMGGKDKDKKVVMSLCTGQRNISAALLVAAENFKDKEIILTLVAISIIGLLFRVPYARWIGKRVRRNSN